MTSFESRVRLKKLLMKSEGFMWALMYQPIAVKDVKCVKGEDSFIAKFFAISFGAFLRVLEIWKQGNVRSPGIFSGGISIKLRMSEDFT